MTHWFKLALALGALSLMACGDDGRPPTPDTGAGDTGTGDGGMGDSAMGDSAMRDSAMGDSAMGDTGTPDTSMPMTCATVTCDTNATCDDSTGTAVCTCNAGWSGDGMTCTDDDECTATPTICGMGTCVNEDGGYSCTCDAGYMDDGTTCVNIDECTVDPTVCGMGTCVDAAGSYSCTCDAGYMDDGTTCVDIDECAATPCGAGTCTNNAGGYSCTCPAGYMDDGTTCVNIDECMAGTDTCDVNATCADTPGSFTCTCNAGYAGSGMTCRDLDECARGTDTCTASQVCLNNSGSFTCACLPGRTGASCALGSILLYDDNSAEYHAETAATALGYTVNRTTSRAAFNSAFDAGGFDLVIYDAPGSGLDAAAQTRLSSWIAGGGRLIFGAYNLNSFAPMQSALGVSVVSYNTARSVYLASGAVLDIYDQFEAINSPMTTTRDAGDNGDELTLTGSGVVLANLDSAAGPGAMVLTNGNRVLVNGFLPFDIGASDDDADMTLDMVEMYRNQINLVMNPIVLSYNQSGTDGPQTVARRIQWTAVPTTTGPNFATAYDANLYDFVVVDAPGSGLPAQLTSRLTSGIPAGDKVIFSWWDLDSSAPLQSTLGVSVVSFSMPRDVYYDRRAPIDFFNLYQSVPSPLTNSRDAGDNGDECTPTAGGSVSARFDGPSGPGAICITNSNSVVVNGFLPFDVFDVNTDGDLLRDMEELYENQFYWIMLP